MKFNVPSKTLYGLTSAVSKVINSKNALTILNNFLFELKDGVLSITASDLENTLTCRVEVTGCVGEGRFCVDARRVVELLKSMPDVGITFEIDDASLEIHITYNNGNYSFVGINGNEYPMPVSVADESEAIVFACPAEQIIKGIDNTIFAVGNDDLRPQMMGILWDIDEDGITFVATDTRKLVKYRNSVSAPAVKGSCIIPFKPATVIKNVFGKESELRIRIDGKCALIENDTFTFTCQLLKGMFPDYNRVIPQNNPYVLTIDRLSLLAAVRRVGVFVDPGHGLVKFKINPELLTLKATDSNFCTQAIESLPCTFNHDEMVIGFGSSYLSEIFSSLNTTEVVVKLSDPSRAGVFLPGENGEHEELLMLLMPMNAGEF